MAETIKADEWRRRALSAEMEGDEAGAKWLRAIARDAFVRELEDICAYVRQLRHTCAHGREGKYERRAWACPFCRRGDVLVMED